MEWVKSHHSQTQLTLDFSANVSYMFPLDAGIHTVNHIIKEYPPPYTLMLSGGIDSQSMLWAWYKSGHEFKTISAKYNNDMNSYDLKTLEEFSLLHQIPITFVDFDLLNFLENDYDNWAITYNCSSPQICAYMKIASMVNSGTRIFSGNFMSGDTLSLNYTLLGIQRYSEITNTPIVPFFFLATPELTYAFNTLSKQNLYLDGYDTKVSCYQKGGYPVIPQETKYTGFENVKDYYDQHYKNRVTAKHKLNRSEHSSCRVFDLLLRYPYEKKLKIPKLKIITNVSSYY